MHIYTCIRYCEQCNIQPNSLNFPSRELIELLMELSFGMYEIEISDNWPKKLDNEWTRAITNIYSSCKRWNESLIPNYSKSEISLLSRSYLRDHSLQTGHLYGSLKEWKCHAFRVICQLMFANDVYFIF